MPEPSSLERLQQKLMKGREYIGVEKIEGPLVFIANTHPVGYREFIECVDREGKLRLGMVLDGLSVHFSGDHDAAVCRGKKIRNIRGIDDGSGTNQ